MSVGQNVKLRPAKYNNDDSVTKAVRDHLLVIFWTGMIQSGGTECKHMVHSDFIYGLASWFMQDLYYWLWQEVQKCFICLTGSDLSWFLNLRSSSWPYIHFCWCIKNVEMWTCNLMGGYCNNENSWNIYYIWRSSN